MKVDLRDKLKEDKMRKELPRNHRADFEKLLQKELHQKTNRSFTFLKIAASVLLLLGLSFTGYHLFNSGASQGVELPNDKSANKINSLGDLSPDLKKVEAYYLTQINYQLAKITITDENRELLEVYLSQLSDLQKEYNNLNTQLNINEISEETINALIENLQLRLQLLRQLKKKLEIIDNYKREEDETKQV